MSQDTHNPFLSGTEKMRLLVVDDDAMMRMLLSRIFVQEADVIGLHSGRSALEWLEENTCDLVLLDYRMPDMDGLDVLRNLRKHSQHDDLPVILLTGDTETGLETEGFALGATDFIRKPFVPDVVRHRVRRLVRYEYLKKHLEQEVGRKTLLAESRLSESRLLFREMVVSLARTVDAKDKYTSGHSERVANYACRIARRAGESVENQEKIYYMGMLHDIGKIGVPGIIINKEDALSKEEYARIQTHTIIGAKILQSIDVFPDLAIAARCHHERFDGTGYPDRLKGQDIPRFARILAVADSYDAMTSNRSYRRMLPQAQVRQEIVLGRGTQFDPEFADIMLTLIDEDATYLMREITQQLDPD
ncbi:MAG: response regulator [Desulfovibrio sp.]|nr:response regulator [Desulfovibrio sp.]